VPLSADAVPVAVSTFGADRLAVLDATAGVVRVFSLDAAGLAREIAALAVGPGASDVALGPFGPPGRQDGGYVAVTNRLSNDVWFFKATGNAVYGPPQRVSVGSDPEAIVYDNLAEDAELVVANAGSGTVSLLGLNQDGHAKRVRELHVGGAPSLLVRLSPFVSPDLVVADGVRGRLTLLHESDGTPQVTGVAQLPPELSRPSALVPTSTARDGTQLAVADRTDGTVGVVAFKEPLTLGAVNVLIRDADPVGLANGDFGGDFQGDLAVADGRDRSVSALIPDGDRLVFATPRAPTQQDGVQSIDAGRGWVVWEAKTGRDRYRIYGWDGRRVVRSPAVPATQIPVVHLGLTPGGRPMATFAACARRSCSPTQWLVGGSRPRAVRFSLSPGCMVSDLAIWRRQRAYVVTHAPHRACPASRRGVWRMTAAGPPRRLDVSGDLGGIRDRVAVWRGPDPADRHAYLDRVLTPRGRIRTLARGDVNCCRLNIPFIDGPFAYLAFDVGRPTVLERVRVDAPRRCHDFFPRYPQPDDVGVGIPGALWGLDNQLPIAADGSRLYYANVGGVWMVDRDRVRWVRSCATRAFAAGPSSSAENLPSASNAKAKRERGPGAARSGPAPTLRPVPGRLRSAIG
jgi:hypothetical protein